MSAAVKVVLNRAAVGALLRSPTFEAECLAHAQLIADAANGSGVGTYEASAVIGAHRARASVMTADDEAMVAEFHDHTLTASLDAGRG